MSGSKVRIVTNNMIGTIFVDGREVRSVTGYAIEHKAGQLPKLMLSIFVSELLIEHDEAEISAEVDER